MKILRTSGLIRNLIFVHPEPGLEREIIHPSIPNDFLTKGKYINWQLPRIKLYTRIGEALSAKYLDSDISGQTFSVYRAKGIRIESLIEPGLPDCPYGLDISEYWYLQDIMVEKLGEITIGKKIKAVPYHYGPRQTVKRFNVWEWEENLKPWEKPKLKQFSILGDIYHSGVKRTYKKNIGKARRYVATRLEKDIRNAKAANNEAALKVAVTNLPIDRNIERGLVKTARQNGVRVVIDDRSLLDGGINNGPQIIKKQLPKTMEYLGDTLRNTESAMLIPEYPKSELKKDRKRLIRFRNKLSDSDVIYYPSDAGTGFLAHEVGHVINANSNGVRGYINKRATNPEVRQSLISTFYNPGADKSSGIKQVAKRYIDGKLIVSEERGASKRGLKLIQPQMNPQDYKKTEEVLLGPSLDTYKTSTAIGWKVPLRNTIQIPSRKNLPYL